MGRLDNPVLFSGGRNCGEERANGSERQADRESAREQERESFPDGTRERAELIGERTSLRRTALVSAFDASR